MIYWVCSVGSIDLPEGFQSFIVAFEFHDHCECIDKSVVFDEFCYPDPHTSSRIRKNVVIVFHLAIFRSLRLVICAWKSRDDYMA